MQQYSYNIRTNCIHTDMVHPGVYRVIYTRAYAVYQPPVYFAGVYLPQLPHMNRVYAGYMPCRVAEH